MARPRSVTIENLSSEFSKLFMDSGFTEMFSEDIIECVRKELKNY